MPIQIIKVANSSTNSQGKYYFINQERRSVQINWIFSGGALAVVYAETNYSLSRYPVLPRIK